MYDRSCTYSDPHGAAACTECGNGVDLCICVRPDDMAHERLHGQDGLVFTMIRNELVAARTAFPTSLYMLAALGEEVGELCKALMEHSLDQGTSAPEILREAVQVACMAIRVAVEGDADFKYIFPQIEEELPRGPVSRQY